MRINLQTWASQTIKRLQGKSEFPYIESQVLLAFALNHTREWIIAHPEVLLTQEQETQLEKVVQRLLNGEPLPYITGIQAFYGLDFMVTPDVLIPRPETELLVEEAINWLQAHPNRRSALDMGTGSGAIAVTLADQVEDLNVTAADISPAALDIARKNAEKFEVEDRVRLIQSDLWQSIDSPFDLIAANLPYVPSEKLKTLAVAQHEPILALDGGADGLQVLRTFLAHVSEHILPGGLILLEIEAGQGESAMELVQNQFGDGLVRLISDYSALPRLITIQAA